MRSPDNCPPILDVKRCRYALGRFTWAIKQRSATIQRSLATFETFEEARRTGQTALEFVLMQDA